MIEYEKRGYLNQNFRLFHPKDNFKQEISYHCHDFLKIMLLIKGDVTYCIEGRAYPLKPLDIVLVNAGEVHRPLITSERTYERIILYVSPSFITQYQMVEDDLRLCFLKAQEEHSNVLRLNKTNSNKLYQMLLELEDSLHDTDYASTTRQNALFLQFMVYLNRSVLQPVSGFMEICDEDNKISAIISYINEHLGEHITIDTLADTFYISKYYLMHSFKKETGYTIGQYLQLKRLIRSRELIYSGTPVTKACLDCGFGSYSTFSRAYKKHFGEAPTAH